MVWECLHNRACRIDCPQALKDLKLNFLFVRYKLLIVDFDNTLLHTDPYWDMSYELVRRCLRIKLKDVEEHLAEFERTGKWNLFGEVDEYVRKDLLRMDGAYFELVSRKPEFLEEVDKVRRILDELRGKVDLVLISSNQSLDLKGFLQKHGLRTYFARVIQGRERRAVFLELMREYGLKKDEVLVLGDTEYERRLCEELGLNFLKVGEDGELRSFLELNRFLEL